MKKLLCIWVLGPQIEEIMKKRGFFDLSVFSAIFFSNYSPFSPPISPDESLWWPGKLFQLFFNKKKVKKGHPPPLPSQSQKCCFFTFFFTGNHWKCLFGHQGDSSGLIGGKNKIIWRKKMAEKTERSKNPLFFRIYSIWGPKTQIHSSFFASSP